MAAQTQPAQDQLTGDILARMRLVVFSHKPCWRSAASPSGFATDGGFPLQMRALSQLFASTRVVVPVSEAGLTAGEGPLTGHNFTVVPLSPARGRDLRRKLDFPFWLLRNSIAITREILRADAIHAPIPGDVGTIGMLGAWLLGKPLFVRHCGNWLVQRTTAERFWKWFMVRFAGGRNMMLATGGSDTAPTAQNPNVHWIFSTSLDEQQLQKLPTARTNADTIEPRLIIACRQESEKGTQTVIESLPLLLPDFPTLTLDVIGDGGALPRFRKRAEELGVIAQVRFHGKVKQQRVLELLQTATLFCYPTRASEGFPKAVLEALACGLPVITTRVSVLPQLINPGSGILLDQPTPELLAAAVRRTLSDPASWRSMSEAAFRVAQQFSLEGWRDTIAQHLRRAWTRTS